MAKILIIEDEVELVKVLRSYLEQAGYSVISSLRGESGLNTWKMEDPDLVILDLNLPEMDGLEIAKHMRTSSDTPIIMVTARVEDTDRIIGLELGADDYITKPFSPREVVARVKAVLRRTQKHVIGKKRLETHDLVINLEGFQVSRQGQKLDLTKTEYLILQMLAQSPGKVFSRLQLLEASQGTAFEGYERTIDAHIKNLRAKLDDDAGKPTYIETVFGVGYKFLGD